jgi:hypothetical protein
MSIAGAFPSAQNFIFAAHCRLMVLKAMAALYTDPLVDDNDVVDACLNHFDDDEYLLDDFEEKKESAFVAWSQRVMEIVFAPVGLQPTVERESPALAPVD